jgi:hypothetical protein
VEDRRAGRAVMAGKHRLHARAANAPVPGQRGTRPVGVTDARTRVEHLVRDESLVAQRHTGRFVAVCGVEVLAASLTDPGRDRCRDCAR